MFNLFDEIGISNVKRFDLAWIDKKILFKIKMKRIYS